MASGGTERAGPEAMVASGILVVRRQSPRDAGFGTILGDRGMGTLAPAGQYLNLRGSEAGTAPSATVRLQAARAEGWASV
jgi:hypothetical protein